MLVWISHFSIQKIPFKLWKMSFAFLVALSRQKNPHTLDIHARIHMFTEERPLSSVAKYTVEAPNSFIWDAFIYQLEQTLCNHMPLMQSPLKFNACVVTGWIAAAAGRSLAFAFYPHVNDQRFYYLLDEIENNIKLKKDASDTFNQVLTPVAPLLSSSALLLFLLALSLLVLLLLLRLCHFVCSR